MFWYQAFGFQILLSPNQSFRASKVLRNDATGICDCIDLMGMAYLDVEVLVNLERLAEEEYVLHQRREFPHVSQSLEQRGLFVELGRLHLFMVAFSTRHRTRGAAWVPTAQSGRGEATHKS